MKTIFKFLLLFLIVTFFVFILKNYYFINFENENYWDHHGALFLLFISLFPRLTLLLSNVTTGGILWWLGWIFAPRLLVSILATLAYWNQNPILVVISWLIAIGGESSEKVIILKKSTGRLNRFRKPRNNNGEIIDVTPTHVE